MPIAAQRGDAVSRMQAGFPDPLECAKGLMSNRTSLHVICDTAILGRGLSLLHWDGSIEAEHSAPYTWSTL